MITIHSFNVTMTLTQADKPFFWGKETANAAPKHQTEAIAIQGVVTMQRTRQ